MLGPMVERVEKRADGTEVKTFITLEQFAKELEESGVNTSLKVGPEPCLVETKENTDDHGGSEEERDYSQEDELSGS